LKVLLYSREGAEQDLSEELKDYLDPSSLGKVEKLKGGVRFDFNAKLFDVNARARALTLSKLIFARQLIWLHEEIEIKERKDFVQQVMEASQVILKNCGANAYSNCFVETTGAEDVKGMSAYCKSLQQTLEEKLNKLKILPKGKGAQHLPKLHITLLNNKSALLGWSDVVNSSPWPSGIPRLRQPQSLVSRSYMKLEETYLSLLDDAERKIVFAENANAYDLGAAPGGWSQFLLSHNISVTAIDHANMAEEILANPIFKHRKENALKFIPKTSAYLMVCDVIEKPALIEEVLHNWIKNRWCKHFVVNFKLPMKQKYPIIRDILERVEKLAQDRHQKWNFRCKQLYHDRDEVTIVGVSLTSDQSL